MKKNNLTQTYDIQYDYEDIATVEIDEDKAAPYIKEMVEFWGNWENNLKICNGNYTHYFLKLLGAYIIKNSELPKDEEGWYPLNEKNGIKVISFTQYRIDMEMIDIIEL